MPAVKTSKLEELVIKLCPNGIEYKTLGECCNILDSQRKPVTKGDRKAGDYPYYGANGIQDYVDNYIFDGTFLLVGEDGSVINKDKSPVLTWATGKIWVNNHAHILSEIKGIKLRYLYFYLQTIDVSPIVRGTPPKINQQNLVNIKIPVPPIPVQEEIVRILDTFTELTAELTAELTKRKQQYQYYRDELLTFGDDVEWKRLGDVCKMKAGKAISASEINPIRTDEYCYDCYGGNGLRGYVKSYNQIGTFSLIGRQGALCGNVKFATGSFYATEHAVVVHADSVFISKFLYYLLQFLDLNQYKSSGAQPGLSVEKLEAIKIPVPSLSEQEHIVSVLDRFDALCNDLTSGLPAEINARKKQYEYYRDKLLTFKELPQ